MCIFKVSVKNNCGLGHVISLVQSVLQAMDNSRDRVHFVNGLMDMFKELILDLHDFSDSGKEDHRAFSVRQTISCIVQVMTG